MRSCSSCASFSAWVLASWAEMVASRLAAYSCWARVAPPVAKRWTFSCSADISKVFTWYSRLVISWAIASALRRVASAASLAAFSAFLRASSAAASSFFCSSNAARAAAAAAARSAALLLSAAASASAAFAAA
ncbi:hypothetical protein D9M68_716450 [compost metagenome]